jgi:hypothetical protein
MNPTQPDDKLEQIIDGVLREQPPLRAPAELESRVMARISRQTTLPWWRKSFAYWPPAARVAFFLASIGFVKLGLSAAAWVFAPLQSAAFDTQLPPQLSWPLVVGTTIMHVVQLIPAVWIYAGAAAFAALYAILFGVGAAAYRTLYAGR